jgi:transcriptional regulator with XRE-family HTH domain
MVLPIDRKLAPARAKPHEVSPALEMVAEAVRAARAATGKSQAEIARLAGTGPNHIWRLEQAHGMKFGPSIDLLDRVATACGRRLVITLER